MNDNFLRLPAVIKLSGLSRSTIYLHMSLGTFPKSYRLGTGRAVGWLESDINNWISDCVSRSEIVKQFDKE